ncbi:hypothetical protein THIOKS11320103 [Thiocapsa sp. KS1]|nr:hypothetical protein THIOKS11320103 [Thiocapsa sp. KS1]
MRCAPNSPRRWWTARRSSTRHRADSQPIDAQSRSTRGIALPLVRSDENVHLQRKCAPDVDGIHATQQVFFQADNRLRQDLGRDVANRRVLDVGQQQRLQLPILGLVDFAFATQAAKGRYDLRQRDSGEADCAGPVAPCQHGFGAFFPDIAFDEGRAIEKNAHRSRS